MRGRLAGVSRASLSALCAASSLVASAGLASAQTPQSPEQIDPTRQAPQTVTPPAPAFSGVTSPDFEASPTAPALEAVVFQLERIAFEGADDRPRAELEALYADMAGRAISLAELRIVAERTERYFQRLGYRFTRVVVPEQRIEHGLVRLSVIRGYIAAVHVVGGSPRVRAAVERVLAPLGAGEIWRDQDGEHQILLAQDIPGVTLMVEARRGAGGPGAIELVARIEDYAAETAINVNNLGAEALGPWSVFAQGAINNLYGAPDRTTLGIYSTSDWEEQNVVQLGHEAMLSAQGIKLRARLGLAEANPNGEVAQLDLHSEALTANLEVSYPLLVSRARRLDATVGLEWVDQYGYAFDDTKLADEHLRVFYGRVEARYDGVAAHAARVFSGAVAQTTRQRWPVSASGAFELRQGLDGLGASQTGEPLLTRGDADPQALVLRANGSARLDTPGPVSLRLRLRGQHSDDHLASYEEFAIGNFTLGRGYDPSSASGDQGAGGSVEVLFGPLDARQFGRFEPFAFVDGARIWNPGDPLSNSRNFSSYGAGVRANLFDRVDMEVTWAHAVHDVTYGAPSDPGDSVLVNFAVHERIRRRTGARS